MLVHKEVTDWLAGGSAPSVRVGAEPAAGHHLVVEFCRGHAPETVEFRHLSCAQRSADEWSARGASVLVSSPNPYFEDEHLLDLSDHGFTLHRCYCSRSAVRVSVVEGLRSHEDRPFCTARTS